MRLVRVIRRSVVAMAFAALAAGCASQPRDQAAVNVGIAPPALVQARDYAALYAPYAMMATAAYAAPGSLNGHNCPDAGRLAVAPPDESSRDAQLRRNIRAWVAQLHGQGWDCRFGVTRSLPCPKRLGAECDDVVGGLEFQVWRRMQGGACREVTIAFRGTDPDDFGDWVSNFRWLTRLVPKFDQYAQVQFYIARVVAHIRRNGCGGAGTLFVSAGHSLGGGLAQQAAYADGRIRYVYAFDPSPVTGFFDLSAALREKNVKGLGVDRAYEQGEILALPRLIVENIFPPPPCNPRVRTVRFNLLAAVTPIERHNMAQLTEQLRIAARARGASAQRVDDQARAKGCKDLPGVPLPFPPPA